MVIEEGPERVRDLIALGAAFDRDPDGDLHLGREGGHSANRIVHATDMTGREVERALLTAVRRSERITVLEYHYAVNLLTEHQLKRAPGPDGPRCFGAYVLDEQTGAVHTVLAKATLLAAGGAGQVYQHTTNPHVATGDGIAMAYRAGAAVANMEFIQFHPTSLYLPGADFGGRSFLITEAVRGDGGILTNLGGERFMPLYDDRLELAPRDVVARAIDDQMKKRGEDHVWLDISHKPAADILRALPEHPRDAARARHRHDARQDPGRAGGALHLRRRRRGPRGADVDRGPVRVRRGDVLGPARGEPARVELAPRGARVRPQRRRTGRRVAAGGGSRRTMPDWDESNTENPQEWILVSANRDELRRLMQSVRRHRAERAAAGARRAAHRPHRARDRGLLPADEALGGAVRAAQPRRRRPTSSWRARASGTRAAACTR